MERDQQSDTPDVGSPKTSERVDAGILRLGLLTFSLSIICFGLNGGDIPIWPWARQYTLPTFVVWLVHWVGGFAGLLATAVLLVSAFRKDVKRKLKLEDVISDAVTLEPNPWIYRARFANWMIALLVFSVGWLGASAKLLEVSSNRTAFFYVYMILMYILGFGLFCVLLSIAYRTAQTHRPTSVSMQLIRAWYLWVVVVAILALWLSFSYPVSGSNFNWTLSGSVFLTLGLPVLACAVVGTWSAHKSGHVTK